MAQNTQNKYYNNYVVHGALALVLRISKVFCVAPYTFEKRGIRVSRTQTFISLVPVFIINFIYAYQSFFRLFDKAIHLSIMARVMLGLYRISVVTINLIGASYAGSRMHLCLNIFQGLDKINKDVFDATMDKVETKKDFFCKVYVVVFYIISLLLIIIESSSMIIKFYSHQGTNHAVYVIIAFIVEYMPPTFLFLFVLLSVRILFALQKINRNFYRLVQINLTSHVFEDDILHFKIHGLAVSYASICDFVRQLVNHDEIVIFFIIFGAFLWPEFTIYGMLMKMYPKHLTENVAVTSYAIFGLSSLLNLLLLTEPCHRINAEVHRTYEFVCKLMLNPYLSVQDSNELQKFQYLLNLDKARFCFLGFCYPARPLFVKIIGALVSYTITLLQLSE